VILTIPQGKMAFYFVVKAVKWYYDISPDAGVQLKGKKKVIYGFLDDPEVVEKLVSGLNGPKAYVQFHLPQIHCASCVWLLENLYRFHSGIISSRVHFAKKQIAIQFDPQQITLRKLAEVLDSIGYSPTINLGTLEEAAPPVSKKFIYQIGIAGFVFGNIMLFSFPEYLGLTDEDGISFTRLFGYLNLLLILPSVMYSASDYFKSAWNAIRYRKLNIDVPLVLGMATLFIRSSYDILSQTGAGYLDSLAGLIFFLMIGKWFQQKTYHQISFDRNYKSYFPVSATRLIGKDQKESISLDKIEPGDRLVIRNGELIPADGQLVAGEAKIDYSFVSGESDWKWVPLQAAVYAGGRQMGSSIQVVVEKRVSQSYLTSLWNDEAFKKVGKEPLQKMADQMGTFFTYAILGIATITFGYWFSKDISIAIQAFTAVLIVACPCAVALGIPFIFGNALRILGKNEFYLKSIEVLEQFHHIDAVVLDKTGTLTEKKFAAGSFKGGALNEKERHLVVQAVIHSHHLVSKQIAFILGEVKGAPIIWEQWEEQVGQGILASIPGWEVRIGKWSWVTGQETEKEGTFVAINGIQKGHFNFTSSYRTGIEKVFEYLKKWGAVFLISGDQPKEQEYLTQLFGHLDQLKFRQTPQAKLQFIQSLQQEGHQVMMIGDGLNDAGALMQSNIGIVISESDNNFTPASDGILKSSYFDRIPQLLGFARSNRKVVYAAYTLALLYNFLGIGIAVQGLLSPIIAAILMPISSVSVVVLGVLGSHFQAYRHQLKR
jgi:Cu+-exporting ATPase